MTRTTEPIACTLGPADLGTQVERWRTLYTEAGVERITTEDGLRVAFRRDPAVERELRALVAVEAGCCAWADWSVDATAADLTLEITADRDGAAVLHSWFLV